MKKTVLHVPNGLYSLSGFNVEIEDNNIYFQSDQKIYYGIIDSSEKKDNNWIIGYVRLGRIRKGDVKIKRGSGLLKPVSVD